MVKLLWIIVEGVKELRWEIADICGDVAWWWRDIRASMERRALARMRERDEEESPVHELEVESIKAKAKRVEVETELVKI